MFESTLFIITTSWIIFFVFIRSLYRDFPGGSVVKNLPANAGDTGFNPWVQSLGQEDPPEEEMTTHSSILAGIIPWTEQTA